MRTSPIGIATMLALSLSIQASLPMAMGAEGAKAKAKSTKPKQPPAAAECCAKAKIAPKKQARSLLAGQVCPIYPVMFHGSYTSYYALEYLGPGQCRSPKRFDGPNNLPRGDCASGNNCVSALVKAKSANINADGLLKQHGLERSAVCSAPNIGCDIVDIGVNYIRFRTNCNETGRFVLAKVTWVQATARDFDPSQLGTATPPTEDMEAGIGYEVATGTARPDRQGADVDTIQRDGHVATVRVKIADQDYRDYQIILIRGIGAGPSCTDP